MIRQIFIGGLLSVLLFCSCSPERRLQRIVEKNPYLLEARVDTIEIPTLQIDTFVDVRYDSIELERGIDSIFLTITDCEACGASKEIIRYISTIKQIKDTLYFEDTIVNDSLDLRLKMEIWQDGTYVKFNVYLKDAIITRDTKVVNITEKTSKWKGWMFLLGVFCLAIAAYKLLTWK